MGMTLHLGDALTVLKTLPSESVQMCCSSPPYWGLRDYGAEGQLGLEKTPDEYVANMVAVFREVRRVLRDDGTLWLNLGDSYAGSWSGNSMRPDGGQQREGSPGFQSKLVDGRYRGRNGVVPSGMKPKDLVGIPWMTALALREDGWWLRSDIIWNKPNCMPSSVKDRPTTNHEYIFLLAKSASYFYDHDAIKEPLSAASAGRYRHGFKDKKTGTTKGLRVSGEAQPRGDAVPIVKLEVPSGRTKRTVWTVTTKAFKGAHFATFPPKLITPCILAGSRPGDTVLDPFNGAGTTGLVALQHGRQYVGIDINPEYLEMTRKRLGEVQLELFKRGTA